jgi:elongation factor P
MRDPDLGAEAADRRRLSRRAGLLHWAAVSISTNQFRNGNHIEVERTKLRRASDGAAIDRTFRAGEKFRAVRTEVRRMQFLYRDGTDAHFMDTESYEQLTIPESALSDALRFMKESEEFDLLYIDDQPADVQLPSAIDLKVTEADPGLRGDTASGGGNKPAVLETGARIQVPLFINPGDVVRVDTRSGEYMSRA